MKDTTKTTRRALRAFLFIVSALILSSCESSCSGPSGHRRLGILPQPLSPVNPASFNGGGYPQQCEQQPSRPDFSRAAPPSGNSRRLTSYTATRCKFNHQTGKWEPIQGGTFQVGPNDEHARRAMADKDHKDPMSANHEEADRSYSGDGKPWLHASPPPSYQGAP